MSLNRLRRPRPDFHPTRRFELTRELAFGSVARKCARMCRKSSITCAVRYRALLLLDGREEAEEHSVDAVGDLLEVLWLVAKLAVVAVDNE